MQGKFIRDKISKTSMEELGCKRSISWVWGCKEGVSQLNGGVYSPWGGQKHHFHSPKDAYSTSQNCQGRKWTVGEQHVV